MKKTEEQWRERGPRPLGIDGGDPYGQFPPSFIQITPKYGPQKVLKGIDICKLLSGFIDRGWGGDVGEFAPVINEKQGNKAQIK